MTQGALSANSYLDRVLRTLAQGAERVLAERVLFVPGDVAGRARATLAYPGGFLLHVRLTVDCTPGAPEWAAYSFQLIGPDGASVMRCDNSRRHPEAPTFPHHRHVGPAEEVQPANMPTLRGVMAEIARAVRNAGTGGV